VSPVDAALTDFVELENNNKLKRPVDAGGPTKNIAREPDWYEFGTFTVSNKLVSIGRDGGGVVRKFSSYVGCLLLGSSLLGRAQVVTPEPANASNQAEPSPSQKPPIEPRKETVVVTGTFEPLPVDSIDRSVSVIDTRESPLLYNHWVDYLQFDPSVDLQQRSPDGVQADLTIRGSTFGQTLVLLDGLRMNDAQSGHHNMDLPVPTQAVERIEILRGAGSTLYGSDAMAGSLNVITGPPKYSEIRFGAGVGNFGVNQQSADAAWVAGRWDEEISLERDFSSGFIPDRDYRSFTAFSNTGAQTALGRTQIMLGYGDKPFGANQFYGNFDSWERTKSWFGGIKQDLGDRTEFDFAYRRHTDEFILFRENPSFYENNHSDESWQTALRRKQPLTQNSTLFYGGEGFHESIDSNNLGQHERSRGAVYLDYDVRAWKRFSFSAGAREEIFSASRGEFSPSVAAGYWLKAGLKLKGSVSHAFRLPTYTDLYYSDPATVGNPNLQPEVAWDYEGGLVWDRGGVFQGEVAVFERREKNGIDYVRASSADMWHAENIDVLNFSGVEASIRVRLPRRQRLQFAYTGLHGSLQSLNGLQSEYISNYPVSDGSIIWQGTLPENLVARTRIGVIDRFDSNPYALWDVSIAREFPYVGAHLELSNLTNTQYQEIRGVEMPGRSVVFGLEFMFSRKGH
jgi:iron complex outermembrane receptor protein